jgi:hypothetical protein
MGGSLTSPNKIKDVYKKIVFYDDNKFKIDNGSEDVVVSTETTLSEIETTNFADSSLVLESEGLNSSDNDTSLPTTAAVKDYVDNQVTAQDLDFQADTGGALSIDLDSESLTVSGGTGVATTGSGNSITVNTVDSEIDHNSLNNYSSDKHIAHSNITLTAGAGLTAGSGGNIAANRSFAVGAGTGITVNTNDVAVNTNVIATKTYVDTQVSTVNTLQELTDTNISSPSDKALLQYDNNTNKWIGVTEIDGGQFV